MQLQELETSQRGGGGGHNRRLFRGKYISRVLQAFYICYINKKNL